MKLLEAIEKRHSVRNYIDKEIGNEISVELNKFISDSNEESGLNIQLILNEEKAFQGTMAKYGRFSGVKNYIAIVGKKGKDLDENAGYYGEQVVLKAQQLGLNTCWVALTYSKIPKVMKIARDEKLVLVIAIGYGLTNGVPHKSKSVEEVVNTKSKGEEWFYRGVEAALKAPTAMNQQKFKIYVNENIVSIKAGLGFYSKVDLGIVKYHFEVGGGKDKFKWKN